MTLQKLFQDCLLFVFQVSESLQEEFQEKGSFSILKRTLLVREGVESNPGPPSVGETLEWYRETLQNGKLSEAKIKSESLRFFHLSTESQMKDKKLFKRALEGLVSAHTKSQKNLLREVLKMHNGGGVFHDSPPDDYSTQMLMTRNENLCLFNNAERK